MKLFDILCYDVGKFCSQLAYVPTALYTIVLSCYCTTVRTGSHNIYLMIRKESERERETTRSERAY